MNDILCRCGHTKQRHWDVVLGEILFCIATDKNDPNRWSDMCEEYVPDNLSTIEQLARERNLI